MDTLQFFNFLKMLIFKAKILSFWLWWWWLLWFCYDNLIKLCPNHRPIKGCVFFCPLWEGGTSSRPVTLGNSWGEKEGKRHAMTKTKKRVLSCSTISCLAPSKTAFYLVFCILTDLHDFFLVFYWWPQISLKIDLMKNSRVLASRIV